MPSSAVSTQNASSGELEAPSLVHVLAAVLVSYSVFLAFLSFLGGSYLVGGEFGDNPAYLRAAAAIRHWQFSGVQVKQFWGLSYAVAGLSLATRMSESTALVVVCVAASLASVALCYRLWDGWIAAFFALLSLDWFQRSLLGGSEPLFVALLLGSFLALRRDRWRWAAVLGALATVVRPFGVFALIGLAVHLLYRGKVRECAIATAIALAIGALYAWPLAHYLGSPFANVALYQRNDWRSGPPFNVPFVAIIHDTFPIDAPWTNLVLTWGWILFLLSSSLLALRTGEFHRYGKDHTAEMVFYVLCGLALYTYDAPGWSRSNFPRFALPLLPWALVFAHRYIPKDRRVIWALAVISPMLAAASAIGIRHAWEIMLHHWP
jgi:hypothetical protein